MEDFFNVSINSTDFYLSSIVVCKMLLTRQDISRLKNKAEP
jgi:hypothetical protein